MILSDREIRALSMKENPLLEPFLDDTFVLPETYGGLPKPSSGLTSYGYDLRLAPELHLFPTEGHPVQDLIDPMRFNAGALTDNITVIYPETDMDGILPPRLILPPMTFALAYSVEYIRLPEDILGLVWPKSTYARSGLQMNAAPAEPGWEGHLTIELFNATGWPMVLYPNSGICQLIFLRGERPERTYPERSGRYQGQTGVTYPRGSRQ